MLCVVWPLLLGLICLLCLKRSFTVLGLCLSCLYFAPIDTVCVGGCLDAHFRAQVDSFHKEEVSAIVYAHFTWSFPNYHLKDVAQSP